MSNGKTSANNANPNLLVNGNFEHDWVGWNQPREHITSIISRDDGPLVVALNPVVYAGPSLVSDRVPVGAGKYGLSIKANPVDDKGKDLLNESRLFMLSIIAYSSSLGLIGGKTEICLVKSQPDWQYLKTSEFQLPDGLQEPMFLEVRVSLGQAMFYADEIPKDSQYFGPVGLRDFSLFPL